MRADESVNQSSNTATNATELVYILLKPVLVPVKEIFGKYFAPFL
jgi:hypothetical protein